jgi:hypothetical protein
LRRSDLGARAVLPAEFGTSGRWLTAIVRRARPLRRRHPLQALSTEPNKANPMTNLRSLLRSLLGLTLLTAALTAQTRPPLSAAVQLDRARAQIQIVASGAPRSTMYLMFSVQHVLQQSIRTPWGLLRLDPTSIVATVPIQLDQLGLASMQAVLPRPYDPFVLSVQAVTLQGTAIQLTNAIGFAGAGNAPGNVANVLSYSSGTFTAAATGNRGDQIEVKTDNGTVIAAGAVQADGSTVNLSGSVPAGTTSVGLYRNGVLISWVRC